jgi:hypothetical protein
LARLCQQLKPALPLPLPELANATDYAVQLRYDMDVWPSQNEAQEALTLAKRMRAVVLGELPAATHP